jgi:adenine-specific DNA-methyltransferase
MYKDNKLDSSSIDILSEKLKQLKTIFPEVVCEDQIDFDKLKLLLNESIVSDTRERFGLNWSGKADCFKIIQKPTTATLRPYSEESIDFDTTQNLFIEGDNLEVLKLLQRSYGNKVKMIYIDPPYNTGKDFIYPDNYNENLDTYLRYTEQKDEEGLRFATNTESSGRYHSKWLSMMYPRLYLAKSLLQDDGVIFISVDDHEQHHLRMICDQIFGEDNFVEQFVWNGKTGGADDKYIRSTHEYILCYARNKIEFIVGEQRKENEVFPRFDIIKRQYYKTQLARKWGANSKREDRPNLFYSIQAPDNSNVFPMLSEEKEGRWRWSKTRMLEQLKQGNIEFVLANNKWNVYEKIYQPKDMGYNTKKYSSWLDYTNNTAQGSKELKKIMNHKTFDFPKPVELLSTLISIANVKCEDTILDFFSGSATTAHAVMKLNAEDGGNRKYIMVQLPEKCSKDSEAYKAGYKTISDIGKERIRRVAKKILEEYPDYKGDLGFKVFKLDSSNFELWNNNTNTEEEYNRQLSLAVDNIKKDRSQEDILYDIILRLGLKVTDTIDVKNFGDKNVFSLEDGKILVCLEKIITKQLIEELIKYNPDKVIFLDIGFQGNDLLKINAQDSFKNHISENKNKAIEFIVY